MRRAAALAGLEKVCGVVCAQAEGNSTSIAAMPGGTAQHSPHETSAENFGPLSWRECLARWHESLAALLLQHSISQPLSGTSEITAEAKGASSASAARIATTRQSLMPYRRQYENITSLQMGVRRQTTGRVAFSGATRAVRVTAGSEPAVGQPRWKVPLLRPFLPGSRPAGQTALPRPQNAGPLKRPATGTEGRLRWRTLRRRPAPYPWSTGACLRAYSTTESLAKAQKMPGRSARG